MSQEQAVAAPEAAPEAIEPQTEQVEGSEETTEAAPAAQEQKEIKKALKRLQLKVDGEEEDIEYDPEDEEFIKRQFQLAKVSQKRMQQYSQLEKELVKFFDDLKTNPKSVLKNPAIGLDLKELAKNIIEEEVENSKKSPEQIRAEQLEAELRTLKEEKERESEEAKKREFERMEQVEFERLDKAMDTAISKSDLPKSPYVVKKMADYMLLALENGVAVTPDEIMPLVREELQGDIRQMISSMPLEAAKALLGKEFVTQLRKDSLSKVKVAQAKQGEVTDIGMKATPKEEGKKLTYKDFFKV